MRLKPLRLEQSPRRVFTANAGLALLGEAIHEHRHSGIRFVTPAQRHAGQDAAILNRRHALNQQARSRNPSRWSGKTRNWEPVHTVALNPDRELEIQQATPKKLAA